MLYRVDGIVKAVRATLDTNLKDAALSRLNDPDALSVAEIIYSRLPEAVRTVVMNAPLRMIGTGINFGNTIHWYQQEGHGGGYVLLPRDFLRLVAFQMSDWPLAVNTPVSVTSAEYITQVSRFPGSRGCPEHPITAIINLPEGMALEFYSCMGGKGTHVRQASYIPYPRILKKRIAIPEELREAAITYAAYLTAVTTQQMELADKLLQNAKTLINDTTV